MYHIASWASNGRLAGPDNAPPPGKWAVSRPHRDPPKRPIRGQVWRVGPTFTQESPTSQALIGGKAIRRKSDLSPFHGTSSFPPTDRATPTSAASKSSINLDTIIGSQPRQWQQPSPLRPRSSALGNCPTSARAIAIATDLHALPLPS